MIDKIYIAGQEGMLGAAILNFFKKKKLNIINCKRSDLDLTNQKEVLSFFKKNKPKIVINAAGRVGGILDNSIYQHDYLYINTMIGFNLINASLINNVNQFINFGSACIYPKITKQPIKENYLLSSYPETLNEGYSIAKISTLKFCQFIKNYHKKNYVSLQPSNLYGDGDNFDLRSSHVMPALVRKFHEAKIFNKKEVEVWGSGKAKREFLHADDLAEAAFFSLKKSFLQAYYNVGGPDYITIKDLANIISKVVKYNGKIIFNTNFPDGVKERKLDSTQFINLGWKPKIKLKNGLVNYYKNFIKKYY
jgi:GDP-L-fucose synthase